MPPPETIRPTDDEARQLARTLLRTARFAALACVAPDTGSPLASRVSLATDQSGHSLILISRLSSHFGALEVDPRASLLVGEPGKGDPLAHPRITLTGRAEMLDGADRSMARNRFLSRHPKASLYADFADFAFWTIRIGRASLNGGFGKAFELTDTDLLAPVCAGLADAEPGILEHMNADHADAVELFAGLTGAEPAKWRLTGIDSQGLDLIHGDAARRLWFETVLTDARQVRPRLAMLAKSARQI